MSRTHPWTQHHNTFCPAHHLPCFCFRRDDPEAIGDVFETPPPLENVDLDTELDM